jgi:hypothetical protein
VAHVDIWYRPWAFHSPNNKRADRFDGGEIEVPFENRAPVWIITDEPEALHIDGARTNGEPVAALRDGRKVIALPLASKQSRGLWVETSFGKTLVRFAGVPDVPIKDYDPNSGEPTAGDVLMARVKQVWARLQDVEAAIGNPSELWFGLRTLWLSGTSSKEPTMSPIVKQARTLRNVVDRLDKSPRRILRRVHRQVSLSRVQEIDRRAMVLLFRAPGQTVVEQGGDRQRIMAVVREDNFNTLENRVLMSYAGLANEVARAYAPSNLKRSLRGREIEVRSFGKRCKTLADDFQGLGVNEALPDVTPNFVLQNNANYHAIWEAWRELLRRRRMLDDLWRWQTQSWEEFCALALVVALQSIDGAEVVATSPIVFRDEQRRGRWVESVNPLGVLHLTQQRLIVEVQYGAQQRANAGDNHFDLCAPIWLRVGRIGDAISFLARLPVWPIWDLRGGLVPGEASEVDVIVRRLRSDSVRGALILRPQSIDGAQKEVVGNVAQATLGSAEESLRLSLEQLSVILRDQFIIAAGQCEI